MESKLANLSMKLEDTEERVKSAQQLVKVDLQLATEVSFPYLSLTSKSLVGCLSMFAFHFHRVCRRCRLASPVSSKWSMPGWPSLSFS